MFSFTPNDEANFFLQMCRNHFRLRFVHWHCRWLKRNWGNRTNLQENSIYTACSISCQKKFHNSRTTSATRRIKIALNSFKYPLSSTHRDRSITDNTTMTIKFVEFFLARTSGYTVDPWTRELAHLNLLQQLCEVSFWYMNVVRLVIPKREVLFCLLVD